MAEKTGGKSWHLIIRSNNDGLHEHVLKPGQNNLGRDVDNDIILNDHAASGYHASIHFDQTTNSVAIRDLRSTNGTFVNGKRIRGQVALQHDDQIRVGFCLITILHSELQAFHRYNARFSRTKVTSELLLESIDQYGILLHDIGQRLVNIPDLDAALTEITKLLMQMIDAEECQILLADNFGELNNMGIPTSFAQKIIENKTATIFSNTHLVSLESREEVTLPVRSTLPMLLVPVMIDENVVAVIFAKKSLESSTHFYNSDLQLALAVSNQVAMSIQRSRVEGRLIHLSYHDPLTDLPNRALFLDRLSQSIIRAKQENEFVFAVLFFDIDDFKVVNDSLGHATGDKLLIAIAERIKHNVRNIDIVARSSVIARFGGDEFAILLDNIKESQFALSTANRLKEILSMPFNINGNQIFCTVSIGVTVSSVGYDKPDDVLQDADIAMYRAKDFGKARVEIYDEEMRIRVSHQMRIGTALRQGALQKEFRLHYQPIISLHTGYIVGFEALVRWYTPDHGILYPADFMDAIDTAGLIYSTDHWVIQNACKQAVAWSNEFPNTASQFISINLSAKNIKHPNLVDNIQRVLQETKMEPNKLWLEVTEKVSTPDDETTIQILKKLRSMGVRISLDDFGTGYSALNYLARFPVDVLKIDQSFVQMIGANDENQKIIEVIKALASQLGLIVIAEGVEKSVQLAYLQTIKCDYAQGYYFAEPLDAQAATELLQRKSRKILPKMQK